MGEKSLSAVSVLYSTNARQIPQMLRKLAGEIESPPVDGVSVDQCLCIIRDSATGQLNIYGWGDVEIDNSLSMIAIAQRKLASIADGGDLWRMPDVPASTEPPKDAA